MTGKPLMEQQALTDAVFTLHARQESDAPWLTSMYNTLCQHADAIDQLSQFVMLTKNKQEADILGTAVKMHSEVEQLRDELSASTKVTFHQVDADLDKIKEKLERIGNVVELMSTANIE